jgi:aspartate 1-decarboxylase
MLRAKIHRAVVTGADLDYEGSVTIDKDLMDAADLLDGEALHVWNVTRGTRLVTYAVTGQAGSGVVCINGAAAHLNQPGDVVILAAYADMPEDEARRYRPLVVRVDARNRIVGNEPERPGPQAPLGLPRALG